MSHLRICLWVEAPEEYKRAAGVVRNSLAYASSDIRVELPWNDVVRARHEDGTFILAGNDPNREVVR